MKRAGGVLNLQAFYYKHSRAPFETAKDRGLVPQAIYYKRSCAPLKLQRTGDSVCRHFTTNSAVLHRERGDSWARRPWPCGARILNLLNKSAKFVLYP
jgi:hypothetical protein